MGWDGVVSWVPAFLDAGTVQITATVVTALATVVLVAATWVLAKETRVLSRTTSQAHVTLTLEPNAWAAHYVDIVASNSGNGVAYDIEATFDPQLPTYEGDTGYRNGIGVPFQRLSVLRPGQTMQSSLCEFEMVAKKAYRVTVSWKHHPKSKRREELSYQFSMMDYDDVTYLGARSPFTQIADQMKKMREDWQHIARGRKRIQTEVYDRHDRAAKEAKLEEFRRRREGKE